MSWSAGDATVSMPTFKSEALAKSYSASVELDRLTYNPHLTFDLRKRLCWSRARLGRELDLTERQIYSYEHSQANPPLPTLGKLYAFFVQHKIPAFPIFVDKQGNIISFALPGSLERRLQED